MSVAPSLLRALPRAAAGPSVSSLATPTAAAAHRVLGLGPMRRALSTPPTRAEHVATPIRAAPLSPPPLDMSAGSLGASLSAGSSSSSSSLSSATTSSSTGSDKKPAPRRREIKAKKAALTMTPEAITRLRALSANPTEPKLLRIGVKTRGCAGMAYHLDYVDPPGGKFDEVVEQDGVRVLIDSKALFSIIGSRMDWRDNRLSAGFVFDNPNIVDTCGCGESFNIKF